MLYSLKRREVTKGEHPQNPPDSHNGRSLLLVGLVTGLLWQGVALGQEAAVEEAKRLLEAREPEAAYQELRRLDETHAGKVEYDYWLGVAALQAGYPSEAMVALQRVILSQPRHAGARMELVGAHIRLGQLDAARTELAELEGLDPPPEARQAIRRYREIIDAREARQQGPRHQFRLSYELGYDSNAQRFPSQFIIDPNQLIPDDLAFLFEEAETIEISRQGSTFQQFGAGYQGRFPLDDRQTLEVDAAAQSRYYRRDDAQPYNLTALQGQLGWRYAVDAERSLRLSMTGLRAWNDTGFDDLLTRGELGAGYTHPVGLDSTLSWTARWQDNRFDQTPRSNYESGALGLEWRKPREGWTLKGRALIEREWAGSDGADAAPRRDGGDLDHYLLGLGVDIPVGTRQLWQLSLDRRWRDYQDDGFAIYNAFTPGDRRDDIWEVGIDWYLQLTPNWLVQAAAAYENRDSTLEFFDSNRVQTRLGFSYVY